MDDKLIKDLLKDAVMASHKAHVPYSRFPVGAVIVLKNGQRIFGANIENASYPVSICAERTAMAHVIMQGVQNEIDVVVVVTKSEKPGTPCGMCRQFLSEFLAPNTPIICGNHQGQYIRTTMGELLPLAFTKDDLTRS